MFAPCANGLNKNNTAPKGIIDEQEEYHLLPTASIASKSGTLNSGYQFSNIKRLYDINQRFESIQLRDLLQSSFNAAVA